MGDHSAFRLAVLIVGYRSKDDLPECLESLHSSTYRDFQLVFVDNTPEEGTSAWVRDHYPKATVLEQRKNLGFAEGNNVGLRHIMQEGFTHALLLNPDTAVDREALSILMKEADERTVRQPLILLHADGKRTDLVNTSGTRLNYLGFAYVDGYRQPRQSFPDRKQIGVASGAAALVPVAVLRDAGLFPDSFFMYHEDVDLFWRLRMAGYGIELLPEAVVWHKYEFSRNRRKFFFVERNRMFFLLRCYQWRTLLLVLPFGLVTELLLLAFAAKDGWLGGKLAADWQALISLPRLLAERRAIQKNRRLPDRELRGLLADTLDFGEVPIPGAGLFNWVSRAYWRVASRLM